MRGIPSVSSSTVNSCCYCLRIPPKRVEAAVYGELKLFSVASILIELLEEVRYNLKEPLKATPDGILTCLAQPDSPACLESV